ncbi:MAG: DUF6938 domain-containing protein [Bacteroidota bacterium]
MDYFQSLHNNTTVEMVSDNLRDSSRTLEQANSQGAIWLVAADMGYGHRRAAYPLRSLANRQVLILGENDNASPLERKLWERLVAIYAGLSRARNFPIIGIYLFGILERMLSIPPFYPVRDLSHGTLPVEVLGAFIRRGLCSGALHEIQTRALPMVTSFYAPAIAADLAGSIEPVYCIICDADLNRIWVVKDPSESRIQYFAPCGKAAQRLQAYGVRREQVFLTGFPLPEELLGGSNLPVLKRNLMHRLIRLDPCNRFFPLHGKNVEHYLGRENSSERGNSKSPLTITYAVGGAGAQREIGAKIAMSLKDFIKQGKVKLNLVAGIHEEIGKYFLEVRDSLQCSSEEIAVFSSPNFDHYYEEFTFLLHSTDILWTKPSELSFYCALGLPIIMAPAIGPQEKFNRRWLREIQAGVKQEKPEFAHQWLIDMLENGRLAEAAWSGFLKARKLGLYKIRDILSGGSLPQSESSPLLR